MLTLTFVPGAKYTRADVKEQAGLPRDSKGGPWDTGIAEHEGEFVIFANVGTEGRTGDDYDNRWVGESLHWCHKHNSHANWRSVKRLLESGRTIHVFWRTSNKDSFVYAGPVKDKKMLEESSPVRILLSFP